MQAQNIDFSDAFVRAPWGLPSEKIDFVASPDVCETGAGSMQATVRKNSQGCRMGQDNPRAKLRDSEVDLLLDLRDGGMSLQQIAEKFEVSKSCVAHICSGRRRS